MAFLFLLLILAYLGFLDAVEAASIDASQYLAGMDRLLSLFDGAVDEVSKAWAGGYIQVPLLKTDFTIVRDSNNNIVTRSKKLTGYSKQYKTYLEECATHIGMSYGTLFYEVQVNSGSVGSHEFEQPMSYFHHETKPSTIGSYDWETWGLPADYECDGPCTDEFRTPAAALTAHRKQCGDGMSKDVDKEVQDLIRESATDPTILDKYPGLYDLTPGGRQRSAEEVLRNRKVEKGCGRSYYDCPSDPDTEHQVLTCAKNYTYKDANGEKKSKICRDPFRRCMGHMKDHHVSWPGSSKHSTNSLDYGGESPPIGGNGNGGDDDDSDEQEASTSSLAPTPAPSTPSPGLSPLAGSSVSRGNSHTAKLVTKAGGYSYVYFYLLPPGDSRHYGDSLGDAVRPSTSGVETELNFTVNFASDVTTGDYKLTTYIYPHATASDQTCYEYSYTITVE